MISVDPHSLGRRQLSRFTEAKEKTIPICSVSVDVAAKGIGRVWETSETEPSILELHIGRLLRQRGERAGAVVGRTEGTCEGYLRS